MRTSSVAASAEKYCERGLALVRVPPGEKGPRHAGWNDPGRAIRNPREAREHFAQYVAHGVAALLEPSGLVSIDVDDEQLAEQVLGHLGVDLHELRRTAPVVVGRHSRLMYRAPAESLRHRVIGWPKREGTGAAVILELRAGRIADTLPPTIHPGTGEPYRWENPPREGFPPLPGRVLELWRDWPATQHAALALCPWYSPPRPVERREPKAIRPGESVIDAFNGAHDAATILEAHGYTKRGRRFASPDTAHAAGVVELDDGRVYCHHAGDVLATGRALDAFDVFRLLDHGGDWRAAVKAAAAALGINNNRGRKAA